MVAISTIFRQYHMPFHRDDLTLLVHVLEGQPNVPSNFEFISHRNNPRQKLSIYFNKTKPLLNSYSKRRLAAMFQIEHDYFEHSEILSCAEPNTAKLFLTVYFKRKAYFPKIVPFYRRQYLSLSLDKKMSGIDFLTVATNFRFLLDFY